MLICVSRRKAPTNEAAAEQEVDHESVGNSKEPLDRLSWIAPLRPTRSLSAAAIRDAMGNIGWMFRVWGTEQAQDDLLRMARIGMRLAVHAATGCEEDLLLVPHEETYCA
jgi:hypothetical protein